MWRSLCRDTLLWLAKTLSPLSRAIPAELSRQKALDGEAVRGESDLARSVAQRSTTARACNRRRLRHIRWRFEKRIVGFKRPDARSGDEGNGSCGATLLKGLRYVTRAIVTDKLGSYEAARREVLPSVSHVQDRGRNNRAEVRRQPTRQIERQMRRFKSMRRAQIFLSSHVAISNLFRLCRYGVNAASCLILRGRALDEWRQVTCARNLG